MIPSFPRFSEHGTPTHAWAAKLRGLGLSNLAADLLEAAAPLSIALAQLLYVGQPLLGAWLPDNQITRLAGLLEDEEQSASFINELRRSHS